MNLIGGNLLPYKDTKFTFTPTQHWSARGIFDRNLWGN